MRYLLMLLIQLFVIPLYAWQHTVITGTVVNEESGSGVNGASVYISNSTFGTTCNAEGQFALSSFPPFPFALTISAIGYETAVFRIPVAGNTASALSLSLKPKLLGLEEITITPPEKNGWKKYGALFTEEFIGYSAFAAQCTIVNKEVLQFNFDLKSGILKVWADAPLQVRNQATGYDLIFWLDDFELDRFKHTVYFRGATLFRERTARNAKQADVWRKNRQTAYGGSINHFMRSLYKGNAAEEGFDIRKLLRIPEEDAGDYLPERTDTIIRGEMGKLKKLLTEIAVPDTNALKVLNTLIAIKGWWEDSLQTVPFSIERKQEADTSLLKRYVFTKDTVSRDRIIVCYYTSGKGPKSMPGGSAPELLNPMPFPKLKIDGIPGFKRRRMLDFLFQPLLAADSMVYREETGQVNLRFADFLHITYTREKEDPEYVERRFPGKKMPLAEERSIIGLKNKEGIYITRDGNFSSIYDLLADQYWSYEKLDKLLPLDYAP